jgi:3',5'-nucleoside bisphosphate phosphatase
MTRARYDDPWRINADLHCHSYISDGTLAPEVVAQRAADHGVQMWALTDHDEIGGLAAAKHVAEQAGLYFVPGVEVSVTWGGQTIHIVGLNINFEDPVLIDGLARTRGGREARARDMAEQLARVGIEGAYEGALRFVGNPALISRTHFARHLVESGVCEDVGQVFMRYLTEGKPGYIEHRWARLSDAVSWIRSAGGVAVIAHPGRYKLNDLALNALFDEFREAGGEAIEVVSGSHTKDQIGRFAQLARDYNFLGSRGSDFHGPNESHVELGQVVALPDRVVPVWSRWTEGHDATL